MNKPIDISGLIEASVPSKTLFNRDILKELEKYNHNYKKELERYQKKTENKVNKSARNRKKANKERNRKVVKTLPITIFNTLTNLLVNVSQDNGQLKDLIDITNNIINKANESNNKYYLTQAVISRNNALTVITSQMQKLERAKNTLESIREIITTFNIILQILKALPIKPPPVKLLVDKLSKLVEILLMILNIAVPVLERVIDNLNDLIEQLNEINNYLESNLPNNSGVNNTLINNVLGINDFGINKGYGTYKGYTFAIKEENNPKFIVRGNKRHYAVALDGAVEVLQSDYSFTLDPNDLIEQLKLKIDSLNL